MPNLSPRLTAAASLVRQGSFVADVGTDHAYLPIALCLAGQVRGAIATDVNRGPLEQARGHIYSCGLEDKISLRLCDGLCGVETYEPDDVLICGMGGDLIRRILSDAPWIQKEGLRLILQPMTHAEHLRQYLCENGFDIVEERLAEEDRVYQIIAAEYTGQPRVLTDMEAIFGPCNLLQTSHVLRRYVAYVKSVYEVRRDGKRSVGADVSAEENLIEKMEEILYDGQ